MNDQRDINKLNAGSVVSVRGSIIDVYKNLASFVELSLGNLQSFS
ncbi:MULTISPECIES: hypothetical protein [unclassified Microcystis]|nr:MULTISPECIES: hypothetical protein [unclassified Microcystis]